MRVGVRVEERVGERAGVRRVRRGGCRPSRRRSSCLASYAAARVAAARRWPTAAARSGAPAPPPPPPAALRHMRRALRRAAAPAARTRRGAARRASWRRCSASTGSRASTRTRTLTLTLTLALTLALTLTQVKSFDDFWERHCANLGQVAFGSFITGAPCATANGVRVSGAIASVAVVRRLATVRLTMYWPCSDHALFRHLVRVGRDGDLH